MNEVRLLRARWYNFKGPSCVLRAEQHVFGTCSILLLHRSLFFQAVTFCRAWRKQLHERYRGFLYVLESDYCSFIETSSGMSALRILCFVAAPPTCLSDVHRHARQLPHQIILFSWLRPCTKISADLSSRPTHGGPNKRMYHPNKVVQLLLYDGWPATSSVRESEAITPPRLTEICS